MIEGAAAFAVAAREARLESIVGLSQWLASPAHPSLATRQLWLADRLFATIPGVAHTIVRPGFFADNYLRLIGFAAHLGVLPSLTGDSRNAPPSNEDIARVAVAALTDPGAHAGRAYRPTGPALLSTRDMADILSNVLGRTVRRLEMPMWMFTQGGTHARCRSVRDERLPVLRRGPQARRVRVRRADQRRPRGHGPATRGVLGRSLVATPPRWGRGGAAVPGCAPGRTSCAPRCPRASTWNGSSASRASPCRPNRGSRWPTCAGRANAPRGSRARRSSIRSGRTPA
jgi:hypothetical protein